MIYSLAVLCLLAAYPASVESFSFSSRITSSIARPTSALQATVESKMKEIIQIDAPDFYWEYRLSRLASQKGGDLPFTATNYPDVSGFKDQYDAYYLDLTLQGKLEGFDWEEEKKINDSEWMTIYKKICKWSAGVATKKDSSDLPAGDFDLLKQFYPSLNYRELELPFAEVEFGANFPYKNMKQMLQAAIDGKLSVPGYDKVTSISGDATKAKLAALKVSTMAKLDAIQADSMAYAQMPFPDDEAKAHYRALSAKLADFPQGTAGWAEFRTKMDVEVDEMAKLASKKVDEHHGHGEESGPSAAEEFEAKYGRNLEEMEERMSRYKADPKGFLEQSIMEKHGQKGLDVWKKSEAFSDNMSTMSEADKKAAEKAFSDFIKSAA